MFSNIVDVILPASKISAKDLKKSLEFLKKMNFKPRLRSSVKKWGKRSGKNLVKKSGENFLFAQSEAEAFKNFRQALESEDSRLIWILRGGYGSTRLLKSMDSVKKPSVKKILIGHSDATVLHDWVYKNFQWTSLHFPVLREMPDMALSSQNKFKKLLSGQTSIVFPHLKLLNKQTKGKIISQVTGGNMTLLQSTLGTPWGFSRKGLLFLEDVNEKPYRIHRILWQMKHSGFFKKVRGLIFGKWQKDSLEIVQQVLKPFAESVRFPVFADLPCGHGRVNDPLPLGTRAELSWGKGKAELQVQSPFLHL